MIEPLSLKLESSNDLLKELNYIAFKQKKFGYILSIVGNISTANMQCPGKDTPSIIKGELEIIALNGTISPDKCHLHICISDGDCNLWAGHLREGTIILKGADILIGFLNNRKIIKPENLIKNNGQIKIYTLEGCPWCSRAIRILRTLQIPHEVIMINNDNEYASLNKKTKKTTFPQIFINDEFIGGYTELTDLNASGYLKKYISK